jgi:hypothetical protein
VITGRHGQAGEAGFRNLTRVTPNFQGPAYEEPVSSDYRLK